MFSLSFHCHCHILIKERQAKDLEALNEMIEQITVESEEEIKIDKIIRLCTRGASYKDNLRQAIVSFSTIESKKIFLRNSNALKGSTNERIKNVAISNDLTKKDREREKQKNSLEVGSWKFVIRGPPRDRKLQKARKQT